MAPSAPNLVPKKKITPAPEFFKKKISLKTQFYIAKLADRDTA
jgi:hypothetical protein